jgi:hypothetical protein
MFTRNRHWSLILNQMPPVHIFPPYQRIPSKSKALYSHFVTFLTVRNYPLAQPPNSRNVPCRLSATAYSIYSQLPSVSGGYGLGLTGIALDYGLDDWWFESQKRLVIFLFITASRLGLEPTQPPIQ